MEKATCHCFFIPIKKILCKKELCLFLHNLSVAFFGCKPPCSFFLDPCIFLAPCSLFLVSYSSTITSLWFPYEITIILLWFSYDSLMTLVTPWYLFLRFLVALSGSYQYLVRQLSYWSSYFFLSPLVGMTLVQKLLESFETFQKLIRMTVDPKKSCGPQRRPQP